MKIAKQKVNVTKNEKIKNDRKQFFKAQYSVLREVLTGHHNRVKITPSTVATAS